MATTYKVLGQVATSASVLSTLYTVPAATQTVCSTLVISNRGASTFYRVAVRPAGVSIANQHYIVYDAILNQYDSNFLTLGISMGATDVLSVQAASNDVSFSLFGAEIT